MSSTSYSLLCADFANKVDKATIETLAIADDQESVREVKVGLACVVRPKFSMRLACRVVLCGGRGLIFCAHTEKGLVKFECTGVHPP